MREKRIVAGMVFPIRKRLFACPPGVPPCSTNTPPAMMPPQQIMSVLHYRHNGISEILRQAVSRGGRADGGGTDKIWSKI